jgi:hypothetical protein
MAQFLAKATLAFMESDEREINEVHSTWIEAVNAGNLVRLLALMADDVVFLSPGQAPFGRDKFSSTFSAAHQTARIRCISELEEIVVIGEVAYTRSRDAAGKRRILLGIVSRYTVDSQTDVGSWPAMRTPCLRWLVKRFYTHTMKSTLFGLLFLLSSIQFSTAGAALSPEGVVGSAIAAVRQDRLSEFLRCCDIPAIATHPRHAMKADAVVALLKTIKEPDLQFEPPAASPNPGRVTIRMTTPLRLDFDLVGTQETNGVNWRIVAIHP